MAYEFRKLYADLVTTDGTVCILYLTWTRFFARWHARSGVEIYRPDGSMDVYVGHGSPEPPENDTPFERLSLRTKLSCGDFELRFVQEHGAFDPPTSPRPALRWSVKLARGRAVASGLGMGDLAGTGYIDWVSITRPTRSVGLRDLSWGRAHDGDRTVVYTIVGFADGTSWRAGARWSSRGEGVEAFEPVSQIDPRGRGTVTLGTTTVALEPERQLYAGDAFAPVRVPRVLDRIAARVASGPTHQTRWLGRGVEERAARGDVERAIYERVTFG